MEIKIPVLYFILLIEFCLIFLGVAVFFVLHSRKYQKLYRLAIQQMVDSKGPVAEKQPPSPALPQIENPKEEIPLQDLREKDSPPEGQEEAETKKE